MQIDSIIKNGISLSLGWLWPDWGPQRLLSDSINSLNVARFENTSGFYSDPFYSLSFCLFFVFFLSRSFLGKEILPYGRKLPIALQTLPKQRETIKVTKIGGGGLLDPMQKSSKDSIKLNRMVTWLIT